MNYSSLLTLITPVACRGFFGFQASQQQNQDQSGIGDQPGAWNGSLLDNLNNQFQLRNVSLLLRSYCGQEIQRQLNNRTANMTLFAPSDSSLSQMFNMSFMMGAAEMNCSTRGQNGSMIGEYCNPSSLPLNITGLPFFNVSSCSPLVLQYHLIPDQVLNLTDQQQSGKTQSGAISGSRHGIYGLQSRIGGLNATSQTLNVTVLHTMLNDTRFVKLSNNQSQVLLLNQTTDGLYLRHGAYPDARIRVNETIHGVNGIAYIIDGVLIPPYNLTATLQLKNLTQFANAVQQIQSQNNSISGSFSKQLRRFQQQQGSQQNIDHLEGITVFAPVDTSGPQFNASSYIIQDQVIYNNGTTNQTSVKALDGSVYQLETDANYTMRIGNVSVIESNILLSNGVLHIIDGNLPSNASNQVGGAPSTQQLYVACDCH